MKTIFYSLTVYLISALLIFGIASSLAFCQDETKTLEVKPAKKVEVCFVLDTTGSMGGLIQGAKDKIWSIANELASAEPAPDIKFGLIGYRDRGDKYATKHFDLTTDIDSIHAQLMSFQAEGGGDGPESVNLALHESVEKMSWSDGREVLKIVFLVGDAPPHMDYDEIQYPDVCKLAMDRDLIINTIQCGSMGGTREIWMDIAKKSEGQYAAILQSGGTVEIKTPFDDEISELSRKLNGTVYAYGSGEAIRKAQDKMDAQNSSKAEGQAERAQYFSRQRAASGAGFSGSGVISGTDDLVAMIMDGEMKLENIDETKLPAEFKKLDAKARKAEIEKRIADRKSLQKQIEDLVNKRGSFLLDEKKKHAESGESKVADSFDQKVKSMIREQAAKKGIDYSNDK